MNREIWKYEVLITDHSSVSMPIGAQVLTAQKQWGRLTVWALVDPTVKREARHFRLIGTGNPIAAGELEYIATVQDGDFVWHLFEEIGRV